ncbi:Schlafen-like protein 1 [Biomphalaria glabrata]|nr:Schlafen-like protein 1 [Biomphalaria glabrata]
MDANPITNSGSTSANHNTRSTHNMNPNNEKIMKMLNILRELQVEQEQESQAHSAAATRSTTVINIIATLSSLDILIKNDRKKHFKDSVLKCNNAQSVQILFSFLKEIKCQQTRPTKDEEREEKMFYLCCSLMSLLVLKCLLSLFSSHALASACSFEKSSLKVLIKFLFNEENDTCRSRAASTNTEAVEVAIATLASISRFNRNATMQILKSDILKALPRYLRHPEWAIASQSANLGASLLYRYTHSLQETLAWNEDWALIIKTSLDVLCKCNHLSTNRMLQTDNAAEQDSVSPIGTKIGLRRWSNALLMLLMNRIYDCPEANKCFFNLKGLKIVFRTYQLHHGHFQTAKSAVQLFRNFIEISCVSKRLRDELPMLVPDDLYQDGVFGIGLEEDDQSLPCKEDSSTEQAYTLGEILPARDDYEFFTGILRPESLARIVCGMLNTGKGGEIFLGVSADGCVKGETMSRNTKDEIRLGVDQICDKITPCVLECDVNFTPVRDESGLIDGVFVARIQVASCPMKKIIFECNSAFKREASHQGECFYRLGGKNVPINEQHVWTLKIKEIEQEFKREAQGLIEKLQSLL